MSSVYNPFAREPHYHDLVRGETFHGPRAPALLPEDARDPDVRVPATAATKLGLLAQDVYGTPHLWWVIADANDLIDPFNFPTSGELRVPSLTRVQVEILP